MDPKLEAAHRKLTEQVMGRPGVTGTAVGKRKGKHYLLVYLTDGKAGKDLPRTVDGIPVLKEVTGDIRAL